MPVWASLQAYGSSAYAKAVDDCLAMAEYAAGRVAQLSYLELVLEPSLTVVLVRRLGWGESDYEAWSDHAIQRGVAFVIPMRHRGETVLRFSFVNPLTTRADVDLLLDDLG